MIKNQLLQKMQKFEKKVGEFSQEIPIHMLRISNLVGPWNHLNEYIEIVVNKPCSA